MQIDYFNNSLFAIQCTWFIKGCRRDIAPSEGHTITQQPQYQHSPGYNTIGGWPVTEFGMNKSTWQISTQLLHPVHFSASKIIGFDAAISGNCI